MRRLLIVVGVLAALGGLFVWGLLRGEPDRAVSSNLLGRTAPSFELPVYERYQDELGPTLAFDAGAPTTGPAVINFWASWCGPCYQEAPALQRAWQRYGTEVLFIGVQTQDRGRRDEGRAFLDQFDLGFANVIDDSSALSVEFGVFGVPETFFVAADGTVVYRHTGPVDDALLAERVAELTR